MLVLKAQLEQLESWVVCELKTKRERERRVRERERTRSTKDYISLSYQYTRDERCKTDFLYSQSAFFFLGTFISCRLL
eukprot:c37993_g1_i1 orf=44-277(+)